nr:Transcriptional regulator, AraC family [Kibdelosporangium sp. MJ126-NF4]CTQ91431.1 Transcriptional regulator, AraC family [Kibdelosporangium sp. MJ126-NF4]
MAVVQGNHGRTDALSDVLQAIHLHGGDVVHTTSDHQHAHPAGTRKLHIVENGKVHIDLPGARSLRLEGGDLVLLARGDAHAVRPVDTASWVTGEFLVDDFVAAPLLKVLPPAIVICGSTQDGNWLPMSLDLMLDEVRRPMPGSRVMISRVLDLFFIRALRIWAASEEPASPGWLTAAMDPALAPALSAIHQSPERDWSVDELARLATLSRSAFATRFATLLGQPPGAYITTQRLTRAAHLLHSTNEPVSRVATTVGYASEAAFSRAFTRTYGTSPRTWRLTRSS